MNKDLLNQLPADEQPAAAKLDSVADSMQPTPGFQWELETRLMDAYRSKAERRQPAWFMKLLVPVGWAVVAISALFLLNWTIRTLAPVSSPAAGITSSPEMSFEENVRQGNICAGPLAVGHGFDVFLTNEDKTALIPLDPERMIGELRSFAWSPDGEQLAIVANTMGQGNIYFTDPTGGQIGYLFSSSELGYLFDATWSRDGKRLLTWPGQTKTLIYLLSTDGAAPVEKQLALHFLGTPQFTPDGESVVFYGADSTSAGLFEVRLDDSRTRVINPLVEDETGFAFSPDGLYLAYMTKDRASGGAILMKQEMETGAVMEMLGSLPIPKGSGSSLPRVANLSWSPDGRFIVFEFGQYEMDRAIYLAYTDGTGLVKVAESAHAPAISADGRCLAYIRDKQVFLLNLAGVSPAGVNSTPILLAGLPTGRGIADLRLDKLQWRPSPTSK